jgi:hypothetical protein
MSRPRVLLLLLVALLVVLAPHAGPAQPGPSKWWGQWTSPSGFLYLAEIALEIRPDGTAEAAITWTLAASPRESELQKLGTKGIEYVRGRFDKASGVLSLDGYRKEDPSQVIGLDHYRLVIAENHRALAGISSNRGDWLGRLWAVRVDR